MQPDCTFFHLPHFKEREREREKQMKKQINDEDVAGCPVAMLGQFCLLLLTLTFLLLLPSVQMSPSSFHELKYSFIERLHQQQQLKEARPL